MYLTPSKKCNHYIKKSCYRFDICELKMKSPTSDSSNVANNGKCEDESLEFTASGDLFMVMLCSLTWFGVLSIYYL